MLTVTQQSFATVFDMGAGNDVINFGAQANGVTVVNAETVNGSDGNDVVRGGDGNERLGAVSARGLPPAPVEGSRGRVCVVSPSIYGG